MDTLNTHTTPERLHPQVTSVALDLVSLLKIIQPQVETTRSSATELLHLADGVLNALDYADHDHELADAAPVLWEAGYIFTGDWRQDTHALGVLMELEAVTQAPDVVMRLLKRLHEQLVTALLTGEPRDPDDVTDAVPTPFHLKASIRYLHVLADLDRGDIPSPERIEELRVHDPVVGFVWKHAENAAWHDILQRAQALKQKERAEGIEQGLQTAVGYAAWQKTQARRARRPRVIRDRLERKKAQP